MQTDKSAGEEFDRTWSEALEVRAREREKRHRREAAPPADRQRLAGLIRTIEGEIVPRLLMSQRAQALQAPPRPEPEAATGAADVAELVRLLIAHGPAEAGAFVTAIRRRGTPLNRICLDLLAPAARHLGAMWEQERCSFTELSYALGGLHSLLQDVSSAGKGDRRGAARE